MRAALLLLIPGIYRSGLRSGLIQAGARLSPAPGYLSPVEALHIHYLSDLSTGGAKPLLGNKTYSGVILILIYFFFPGAHCAV